MKFALLGYEVEGEWDRLPQAERDRRVHNHQGALSEVTVQRGMVERKTFVLTSTGLHGPAKEATTVRIRGGKRLTVDGPFAETKEVLAGFDIIEFDSIQAAVEWSKRYFTHDTHVGEIRPVDEMWYIAQAANKASANRFMLTLNLDEAAWARVPESERIRLLAEQGQVGSQYTQDAMVTQAPIALSYVRMRPSGEATTLRKIGGQIVASSGPSAATKETLFGFLELDCAAKNDAIAYAQRLAVHEAFAVEIRPVFGSWFTFHC
jgi:hypothetical protein